MTRPITPLLLLLATALPAQTRLLRFPDLHGDTIVFCYAGDLWKAPARGGTAVRLTSHPGIELFPRFSPDGKWIAFTGQIDGDEQVYAIPSAGGEPRQLTYYPARGPLPDRWGYDHQVYGWTPDGKAVLFRSLREAWTLTGSRLYTVPLSNADPQGALPVPLPMPVSGAGDFSPDGQRLVYSPLFRDFRTWKRYEGGWAQDLYVFDPATGTAEKITDHPRTDRDPMWIGRQIWFCSDRTGTLNLYRYDPESKKTWQETFSDKWDVRWPAAAGPGDERIVYEKGGELYVFDIARSEEQKAPIEVPDEGLHSRPGRVGAAGNIEGYALSPKGKRAVFAARGDLFTVPAKDGPTRNLTRSSGAHDKHPAWSPDGKHIAFVSDRTGEEQIWLVDALGKEEPKQLTDGLAAMLYTPVWSPDGELLAFGDKDGVLRVLEVQTGNLTVIADEPHGQIQDQTWSPCSGWLAFSMSDPNDFHSIYLWSRSDGNVARVTALHTEESQPAFDDKGERLFFLGARSYAPRLGNLEWDYVVDRQQGLFALALRKDLPALFSPKSDEAEPLLAEAAADKAGGEAGEAGAAGTAGEQQAAADKRYTVIDLEGLQDRVEQVPLPLENYTGLSTVPGGLVYAQTGGFYYGRGPDRQPSLHRFDLAKREAKQIAADITGYALSLDRKKLLVASGGGYRLTGSDGSGEPQALATAGLQVDRVPAEEWWQIFHEVWRRFRDFFYVENMHGYDWEALREQYAQLVLHVRHRADLNYVIGEMIGELNVGHAYIAGGDWERPERAPVALPGARFELDRQAGRYRIARILRGENDDPVYRSPLTEVGVDAREGDYVLAIDGEDLTPDVNPYRLLRYKADRPVRLLVHDRPEVEGAREIVFRPIRSESDLEYAAWTARNRLRVEELSGGTLGYLHLPDMGAKGIREFIKWYYPQLDKQGLVVDVRNNGGGNVSEMILERLHRKLLMATFGRTTGYSSYPEATFHGHLVCVLNENSASDGDIFPAMFRRAGLGPLIGKRSWGGIIGITDRGPLIDGGSVNVPEFGNTEISDQGWTIEGHGVDPDIEIDNDPQSLLQGRDPQLEKAVEVLLDKVRTDPRPRPTPPPPPVKTK